MKNKSKIKILFILVIALSGYCVITLTGCFRRDIKNINSRGKNVICFGDSVTAGYITGRNESYPTFLSQMLNMPVINAGIDGDNTGEALRRLDADVLEREPLLVIVEFGGNDFIYKVPFEETKKNIIEMIERIQAKGAMVALVDIKTEIVFQEYGPLFSEIAREKGAIFIPGVFKGIIIDSRLKTDFLHPNANGYKVIAHRIYRGILPYINQNILSKRFAK